VCPRLPFFGTLAHKIAPKSRDRESSSSPAHVFGPVHFHGSDQPQCPPNPNPQSLPPGGDAGSEHRLPPSFPRTFRRRRGGPRRRPRRGCRRRRRIDRRGARVRVFSSASVEDGGGGGGPLMLPVECRWSGRVRTFDMSGAGGAAACPAARRGGGGGKKPSFAPSPGPSRTQAPAPGKTLEERVSEWAARKAAAGVPAHHCVLPFLAGAPKAVRISFLKCSR
jgi:hypothetical protein